MMGTHTLLATASKNFISDGGFEQDPLELNIPKVARFVGINVYLLDKSLQKIFPVKHQYIFKNYCNITVTLEAYNLFRNKSRKSHMKLISRLYDKYKFLQVL